MKTKFYSISILATLLVVVGCGPRMYQAKSKVADELPDGGAYTEKVVPVVTKVASDSEVTLRFYDAMPDVAYISAADFQSIVLPGSVMKVAHTGQGEYRIRRKMSEAEAELVPHGFFRSNKGYLVNLKHVDGVQDGCCLIAGQKLLISRSRKADFMLAMMENIGSSV